MCQKPVLCQLFNHNPNSELYQACMLCPYLPQCSGFELCGRIKLRPAEHLVQNLNIYRFSLKSLHSFVFSHIFLLYCTFAYIWKDFVFLTYVLIFKFLSLFYSIIFLSQLILNISLIKVKPVFEMVWRTKKLLTSVNGIAISMPSETGN